MPNKPTIVVKGYIAKTELRYLKTGLAVLSFSIPIKVWSKKERDGYKPAYSGTGFECTAWFNIVMFGDDAENATFNKGDFVECEVKPNGQVANGYMSPKTFNDRTSYDWIAQSVSLADNEQHSQEQEPADFVEENEIPF